MSQATDDDLLAARAKRTGRKGGLPAEQAGAATGRYPGQESGDRSPLDGMGGAGDHEPVEPEAPSNHAHTKQTNGAPAAQYGQREIELMHQLNAVTGRLHPLQQQLADREAALAAAQHQLNEMAARQAAYDQQEREAKAARMAEDFDPFKGFSQEDLDMMDPATLNAIRASTRATISAITARYQDPQEVVRKTMAEQDKQRRDTLINTTNQDLGLVDLSRDTKFEEFVNTDDSAGLLLTQFMNAPDTRSAEILVPRVRAMVKRYQTSAGKTPTDSRNPDPADALAAHMQRGTKTSPSADGGPRQSLSPAQARDIRLRANAAIRAGRKDEANRLLQQLN